MYLGLCHFSSLLIYGTLLILHNILLPNNFSDICIIADFILAQEKGNLFSLSHLCILIEILKGLWIREVLDQNKWLNINLFDVARFSNTMCSLICWEKNKKQCDYLAQVTAIH